MSEQLAMELGDDLARWVSSAWPLERLTRLKQLTEDGLSCSQIAEALHVTRNAVIGKQHRIGVRSKIRPTQAVAKSKPKKPRIAIYPNRFRKEYTRKPPMDFDNYQSPTVGVVPLNLTFAQLQPGQCKYPYGDENFLFCGNPVVGEKSYCWAHYCLTHTTSRGERPDRVYSTRKAFFPTKETVQKLCDPIDPDERGEAA